MRSPRRRRANRSAARRSDRTSRGRSRPAPASRCRGRTRPRSAGRCRPAGRRSGALGRSTVPDRSPPRRRRPWAGRQPGAACGRLYHRPVARPTYHRAMYLDAMEFLEEERDAWAPYEGHAERTDEQLTAEVDGAHGWTGRDLMAHMLAWQGVSLDAAKELAVNETSATIARVDADWDARGGEVV